MLTENYKRFKSKLLKVDQKIIAARLAISVCTLATDWFGDDEPDQETDLAEFFRQVYKSTGQKKVLRSFQPCINRVGNWASGQSTVLALASYYYLHTTELGKATAEDIDRLVFEGFTYQEKFSDGVPGGYEPPVTDPIIRTPQPVLSPAPEKSSSFHYTKPIMDILGRDEEKETLSRFVSQTPGFRWLQLAGAGGQGKSRLANDLIQKTPKHWEAGFLEKDDLQAFAQLWREWIPTKPHLMVIDYVVGHEQQIGVAMRALTKRSKTFAVPVRILIVERQRWDRGGFQLRGFTNEAAASSPMRQSGGYADWFSKLKVGSEGHDFASEIFRFESGVVELVNLSSDHLLQIVTTVAYEGGCKLKLDDQLIRNSLKKIDASGRPLYAYFLGQVIADGRFNPNFSKEDLLHEFLKRDIDNRWVPRFGEEVPKFTDDHQALQLAFLATMIRKVDCSIFKDSNENSHDLPFPDDTTRRQALTLTDGPIQDKNLTQGSIISGLEPDILGEWFVLSAINQGQLSNKLSKLAWDICPSEMSNFLIRCIQDFPELIFASGLLKLDISNDPNKYWPMAIPVAYLLQLNKLEIPYFLIELFRFKSKENNTTAMIWLACYYLSLSVNDKVAKYAVSLLRKAIAIDDDGTAMSNLGHCYEHGIGVEKNHQIAVDWYKKGAKLNNRMSLTNLGICYYRSIGVRKNFKIAYQLFERSSVLGDIEGTTCLGVCFQLGHGVTKDEKTALSLYLRSSDHGDTLAMHNLAICYKNGVGTQVDLEKATFYYELAANLGDVDAAYSLATILYDGKIVPKDTRRALYWFEFSACRGNADAMLKAGICHHYGIGTARNIQKAINWYEKSALADNAEACFNIASILQDDSGEFRQNLKMAFSFFLMGADRGHCGCITSIGAYYECGLVVEKNYVEALKYYEAGAKCGNLVAISSLGEFYENGYGVSRNLETAIYWYQKAHDSGDGSAMDHILRLKKKL